MPIDTLTKLADRLARKGGVLSFCYEAGPCGYGVYRHLRGLGHDCVEVAPSLIPRRPGDRVKTDRRDAVNLARLHRAGELTPVWVPDADHEAMRDLVRARGAAVRALRRARQQLTGFLLRHGHVRGGKNWTLAHRRWLSTVRFEHAAQQIVLQDYIQAVEDATARRDALTAEIAGLLPQWPQGQCALERACYMEAARSRAHAKQTSHRHSNGRQARHINSGRLLRRHLAGFYTAVDRRASIDTSRRRKRACAAP